MKHLNTLFKETPKFGMPMEQFKTLLAKDERVPKLTDKRVVLKAIQARLNNEKAKDFTQEKFQSQVFEQALAEAIRE